MSAGPRSQQLSRIAVPQNKLWNLSIHVAHWFSGTRRYIKGPDGQFVLDNLWSLTPPRQVELHTPVFSVSRARLTDYRFCRPPCAFPCAFCSSRKAVTPA